MKSQITRTLSLALALVFVLAVGLTGSAGTNVTPPGKVPKFAAKLLLKNGVPDTTGVYFRKIAGADGYQVFRSASKNGKYKKVKHEVAHTSGALTAGRYYKIGGHTPGKTYYYKIRAFKKSGQKKVYGKFSRVQSVTMPVKGWTLKGVRFYEERSWYYGAWLAYYKGKAKKVTIPSGTAPDDLYDYDEEERFSHVYLASLSAGVEKLHISANTSIEKYIEYEIDLPVELPKIVKKLEKITVAPNHNALYSCDGVLYGMQGWNGYWDEENQLLIYPPKKKDPKVTLPKEVENIDKLNTSYLTDIYVEAGSKTFRSIDGVLFSKDGTKLIRYPTARTAETYTVPTSVTSLDSRVFEGIANTLTVNLSDNVTTITEPPEQLKGKLIFVVHENSVSHQTVEKADLNYKFY